MADITIGIAAIAGLGSFLAPCILPVIPAFLAYISGTTITEIQANAKSGNITIRKLNIFLNTVFFVLGFSVVFSIFGVILNSVLANNSTNLIFGLNQVGGAIIIAFGVFMIASSKILKLNIEKKIIPKFAKVGYPLSFVFGLAFATSWTPCIGPILGTILTLAATAPSQAFTLLLAYSFGLGIPFLVMGVFFSKMTKIINALSRHLKFYTLIMGGLIILLGVLVITNQLATIASFPLLSNLLLG